MLMVWIGLHSLGLLSAPQADAYRPDKLEEVRIKTAYTLQQNEAEVTAVLDWLRFDEGRESAIIGKMSFGITDWLTAELQLPLIDSANGDDHAGLGNASIELKGGLINDHAAPFQAAVGLRAGFVTSDPDLQLGSHLHRLGRVSAGDTSDFQFFFAGSWILIEGVSA